MCITLITYTQSLQSIPYMSANDVVGEEFNSIHDKDRYNDSEYPG